MDFKLYCFVKHHHRIITLVGWIPGSNTLLLYPHPILMYYNKYNKTKIKKTTEKKKKKKKKIIIFLVEVKSNDHFIQ